MSSLSSTVSGDPYVGSSWTAANSADPVTSRPPMSPARGTLFTMHGSSAAPAGVANQTGSTLLSGGSLAGGASGAPSALQLQMRELQGHMNDMAAQDNSDYGPGGLNVNGLLPKDLW